MEALATTKPDLSIVPADVTALDLQAALAGDMKKLTPEARLKYYGAVCQFTGLNPLTKPFDWLELQGKLILYANKGCAEQLRKIHGVSVTIEERRFENGCYLVRVKARDAAGREDESIGVVPSMENTPAAQRANDMMKAETKAKRRVTLSICGLGMLDESEIHDAKSVSAEVVTSAETATDRAQLLTGEPAEAEVVEDMAQLHADALEGIRTALIALVPGTDAPSQLRKGDLLAEAFGIRSWTAVIHLDTAKLTQGLEKLRAKLNAPPAEFAAVAESGNAPSGGVAKADASPKAFTGSNPVSSELFGESQPESQPAKSPTPQALPAAGALLSNETLTKLEEALGTNAINALKYLRKVKLFDGAKWLAEGQTFENLTEDRAKKIIANPVAFMNRVNAWVGRGMQ